MVFVDIHPCILYTTVQFAPYADICWMESARPEKEQAQQFAEGVLKVHPHQFLTYNLSPSFNWDATGMNDDQIRYVLLKKKKRCGVGFGM